MGRWSAVSATKRGVVEVVALNPQRNPENRRSKYVEWVPSRGPPTGLCPWKDPIPRHAVLESAIGP
jgi:hypothetical protein